MAKDLNGLKIEAEKEVEKTENLAALDDVYKKYLGKKGELAAVFVSLKNGLESQRKKTGQAANFVKKEIAKAIEQKTKLLKGAGNGWDWMLKAAPSRVLLKYLL